MSAPQLTPTDIATLGPNIAIFVVAVIASIAGIYHALRNLRKIDEPAKGASTLQAGVILDNVSITLWSESNRDVCKANESLKAAIYSMRDEMKDLSHQVERLRDQMERRR